MADRKRHQHGFQNVKHLSQPVVLQSSRAININLQLSYRTDCVLPALLYKLRKINSASANNMVLNNIMYQHTKLWLCACSNRIDRCNLIILNLIDSKIRFNLFDLIINSIIDSIFIKFKRKDNVYFNSLSFSFVSLFAQTDIFVLTQIYDIRIIIVFIGNSFIFNLHLLLHPQSVRTKHLQNTHNFCQTFLSPTIYNETTSE